MNKTVSFLVGMVAGAAALAAAAWFTDKVSRKSEESGEDDSILESVRRWNGLGGSAAKRFKNDC